MDDWGLVAELLNTYDDNYKRVEKLAQHEIYSVEVAVFSVLRDITPFNIQTALGRLEIWFGEVRTIEHCLCLLVLTDYISCAYNQRSFYRTFENALTEKFVDSLFKKLCSEWNKVFSGRHLIHFTDSELESIKKSLSRSICRFPESFRYKSWLNHILQLCEDYGNILLSANLQNFSNNLPKTQLSNFPEKLFWKSNYPNDSVTTVPEKKKTSDVTNFIIRKRKFDKVLPYSEIIVNSLLNDKVMNSSPINDAETSEKDIRSEVVSNFSSSHDSPGNIREIDQFKLDTDIEINMTVGSNNNSDSSSLETISKDTIICICNCCDSKTKHGSGIEGIPFLTAPKKLNAFDILMRKVKPPKRKRIV